MGDSFEDTYNGVRSALKQAVSGQFGVEEVTWTVIEAVAAALDGTVFPVFSAGVALGQLVYDKVKGIVKKEPAAVANPWFVWNGHDEGPTSYTRTYLDHRKWKSRAAIGISMAGALAQTVTVVDVGSMGVHANALGSTSIHLYKFKAIADRYKETRTIGTWLGLIMKCKGLKAGIRGAGLVGASIPVPAVGATTSVLGAAVGLGAKLTLAKACLATAADLHWRAFQEQKLASVFGGKGPAMYIMKELFYRRGATRVFGQYDVSRIIAEPNGWLAVTDKLLLF